jgi:hypothetical protein
VGTPQKGVEIIRKRSTAPGRDSSGLYFVAMDADGG